MSDRKSIFRYFSIRNADKSKTLFNVSLCVYPTGFGFIMYHDMTGSTPKLKNIIKPQGDLGGIVATYKMLQNALSY